MMGEMPKKNKKKLNTKINYKKYTKEKEKLCIPDTKIIPAEP
jgi:hypothetical protein